MEWELKIKVIASLTTMPKRLSTLEFTLQSVIDQAYPISEIHLNIPFICLRTGEQYAIPNEIRNFPRVKIFRTEDLGAVTKIAPTFKRLSHDEDTYIWQVDDDIRYPSNALEILVEGMTSGEDKKVVCRYGGALNSGFDLQSQYGQGRVNFMEGFGGILYPPMCVKSEFFSILEQIKEVEHIRNSDDIFLSMYFNFIGMPIWMHNPLSDQNPYNIESTTASQLEALSEFGHSGKYGEAFSALTMILQNQRNPC
jgi:hypothetical protein